MATGENRPGYEIEMTRAAEGELKKIEKVDHKILANIDELIIGLADEPRPLGSAKIRGSDDLYRLRSGDHRVVYSIDDERRVVTIEAIGDRKDIYRRLR